MAMNPMQRKARNAFLLGFIVALILGGIAIALLYMQIKNKNAEIEKVRQEMQIAMTDVYVLDKDVSTNEPVEVKRKQVPVEDVPKKAIKSLSEYQDEDGELIMRSKIALTKGTILTEDLVENSDDSPSYRMVEYSMITLPSMLNEGDYIDIRIAFPDGGNFVVLSKMEVQSCTASTIWLKLTESQMLTLDEAAIESYIIDGTRLYATQYTDTAQSELNTTYIPNDLVRELINRNSTADESKSMEELTQKYADARSRIESYLSTYEQEETIDKVTSGFQAQTSTTQANRSALLGEMGY